MKILDNQPGSANNGSVFDYIETAMVIACGFIVALGYNPWGLDNFRAPKDIMLEVFAAGLLIFALAGKLDLWRAGGNISAQTPAGHIPATRYFPAITVLAASVLFSAYTFIFIAGLPEPIYSQSMQSWLPMVAGLFIMYRIAVWEMPTGRLRLVALAVAVPAVINALYCILQYARFDPLFTPMTEWGAKRAFYLTSGLIGNPNLVAGYLAGAIPLMAAFGFAVRDSIRRVAWFAAVGVSLLATLFTASKGGLGSAGVGLAFFTAAIVFRPGYYGIDRKKAVAIAVAAGLIAVAAVAYMSFSANNTGEMATLKQMSKNARKLEYAVALEMYRTAPVTGIGLGAFQRSFLDYKYRVYDSQPKDTPFEIALQAHNDYLQLLAETGLAGAGIALIGLAGLAAGAIRTAFFSAAPPLSEDDDSGIRLERWIPLGASAGIAALLANAVPSFPMHVAPAALVFAINAGIVLASGKKKANRS